MNEAGILNGLTEAQKAAVEATGADVLVSAGAGSGKTRTLVARYLSELEAGFKPAELAAITFTEKAAREMRNRIRRAAQERAAEVKSTEAADHWRAISAAMEGARIGTIHSLCAEIIRFHPAEAGLDPEFEVLDEGATRLLQHEAVEAAMAAAANDEFAVSLFRHYSTWALQSLLQELLARRLEVDEVLLAQVGQTEPELDAWLTGKLQEFFGHQAVHSAVGELRNLADQGYFEREATASMAEMAAQLLAGLDQFEQELTSGHAMAAAQSLFQLRRNHLRGGVGRREGPARLAIDQLQAAYDRQVDPWLGGKSAKDDPPDPDIDAKLDEVVELLRWVYRRADSYYKDALMRRAAVDFDGLEAGALALLSVDPIRVEWQQKLQRVMVDEFQDTNERQRRIIDALCADMPGKLFVVGDAQQSIYRFRGADVTIFQQMRRELHHQGHSLGLDRTFRQHPDLLTAFDELLPAVLADPTDEADYRVPYQAMTSERAAARDTSRPPFIEFLIGVGERAPEARPVAAGLLAGRLLELYRQGEIRAWDEVALLFRASTSFSSYEDALSQAEIPYVTVAGRGFYDRPEIREVLNTLRALAEPWNEAAMVGLLRSAAVALSDVAIFKLRVSENGHRPLMAALDDESIALSPQDELARQRALAMIGELTPLVDRISVAELLKKWMDWADARALLAIAGERQWANLDKLLVDARQSGTTRVRAFLEYLQLTQQAGVREGEAPAEASGAVRLMTVHKSKGLEFPLVVLADAGYQRYGSKPAFLLRVDTGLSLQPDLWQGTSLRYRYARSQEAEQEMAEEERLLYVAMTRAREKVLISGHATDRGGGAKAVGWLAALLEAAGINADELDQVTSGQFFRILVEDEAPSFEPFTPETVEQEKAPPRRKPLFAPLQPGLAETADEALDEPPARAWRASGRRQPPAAVVGVLVHRALERWLFPPDPDLKHLLRVSAIGEGLVEEAAQQAAIEHALELLGRFRDHPLKQEVDDSHERYHEIPYTYLTGSGLPDSGAIDLLYRAEQGWRVLDFKTDLLGTQEEVVQASERHARQLTRYQLAAQRLLNSKVRSTIVFLDAMDRVLVVDQKGANAS